MVSDTVVGAIIGVGGAVMGALVTGGLNFLRTRQRIHAEKDRTRAEFYLEEKIKILSKLHSELEEAKLTYESQADEARVGGVDVEEFEKEVVGKCRAYTEAMSKASVFLSEEQMKPIRSVHSVLVNLNGVISESHYVWGHLEDENMPEEWKGPDGAENWDGSERIDNHLLELSESVESAREVLRQEVNEPVKYFETD